MNRHMPNSNPPSAMENDHGPAYPAQPSPYSSNATSPPFTTSTDIFENQTALSVSQPPSPPQPPRRLNTRSCDVCRKRKVKCDKVSTGCSNCTKAHVECHYPAPGRAPRRPKSGKQISAREAELLKRLRRLEGVVQELSGQSEEPQRSATSSPRERLRKERDGDSERGSPFGNEQRAEIVRVVGMDEGNPMTRKWLNRLVNIGDGPPLGDVIEREFGKLVLDEEKSHYINNDLFAALGHEVEDKQEMFEDSYSSVQEEEDEFPDLFTLKPTVGHQSFLFGYSSSVVDLRSLHPLPSQIPFFWDAYVENIDPLTKAFHIPTMTKVIKQAKEDLSSLSKSMEALLFAIYYSVITSMSQEEVKSNFDTDKSTLLARYRFGVEQALARADFLSTSDFISLDAFVLFLFCVRRHDQTKFVWSLTGLAVRLAIGMGLHRDGSKLGLSPFDTEMRRRLWWGLCLLDVRSAEDYGSHPSIQEDSFDTKLPLNINDADLSPDATEPPEERLGVSEMTFCLIRFEMCKVMRYLTYSPGTSFGYVVPKTTLEEKEAMVRELHDHLETKYIQYCLDAGPLAWVTATLSRLIVANMSLKILLRGPNSPDNYSQFIRDRLFIACIEIIEYARLLETGATTKKWGWMFHTYVHWHAIVYILREICNRPRSPLTDRAWRVVDTVFTGWDDAVKHSRNSKNGMLWLPLRKLMAKARRKREEDFAAVAAGDMSRQASGPPEHCALPGEFLDANQNGHQQSIAPDHIQVLRPLQQGIPRPEPQNMPEIYASAPFSPSTWDHPVPPPSYGTDGPTVLQTQYQQFETQQAQMAAQQQGLQSQQQRQGQGQGQQMPWLLEAPLGDLDMDISGSDGEPGAQDDFSWEGFDDLVRDFQMQADSGLLNERGPAMASLGGWW